MPEKEEKIKSKKFNLNLVWIILLIILASIATYFGLAYKKSQDLLKSNPTVAAQIQTEDLVERIGKLMILPTNEIPTVATVTDPSKLKDQPFFNGAKKGFNVLIYTKAGMAILYDPIANKIVRVAPVNLTQNAQAPIRIALYNGTNTVGATSSVASTLSKNIPNLQITEKLNAKNNYSKTEVIDLTGKNQSIVTQLASLLGGEVIPMPINEIKPSNSDFLIIVGK